MSIARVAFGLGQSLPARVFVPQWFEVCGVACAGHMLVCFGRIVVNVNAYVVCTCSVPKEIVALVKQVWELAYCVQCNTLARCFVVVSVSFGVSVGVQTFPCLCRYVAVSLFLCVCAPTLLQLLECLHSEFNNLFLRGPNLQFEQAPSKLIDLNVVGDYLL